MKWCGVCKKAHNTRRSACPDCGAYLQTSADMCAGLLYGVIAVIAAVVVCAVIIMTKMSCN